MNNSNKEQVRNQITQATNILVAVSANPTVDALAASIGLTLALNKLDKHATTVFSGDVPSTIEFLQPEQTIETTTDSLRDFIIALDKSKADKLRYKVEDNVVRIFITPYRTSITQDDLNFTQGDFNVDLVVGIGVNRREDLDAAITAHGRILHDATVLTISNSEQASELGSIHWQETQASSLSEMVAVVTSELQQNLLDGQMSTAFLTGIVAETDRFKNEKTTPLTLSLSSQLMSAGANQQLIAEKLEPQPVPQIVDQPPMQSSVAQPDEAFAVPKEPHPAYAHNEDEASSTDQQSNDGSLSIDHEEPVEEEVADIHIDEHGTFQAKAPAGDPPSSATPPAPVLDYPSEPAPEPESKSEPTSTPVPMPPAPELPEPEELATDSGAEEVHNSYLPPEQETHAEEAEKPTLEQPKTDTPIMKHERVIQPPTDSTLVSPTKLTDKPFDLAAAEETPGIVQQTQPSQPTAAEPPVAPAPAAKPPEQTLSALEEAVDSPHVQKPDIAALQDKAAKAADAVAPQFPTPQEAMQSSAPLNVQADVPKPEPPENKDEKAAPPVPPPMAPQFFDANGKLES